MGQTVVGMVVCGAVVGVAVVDRTVACGAIVGGAGAK